MRKKICKHFTCYLLLLHLLLVSETENIKKKKICKHVTCYLYCKRQYFCVLLHFFGAFSADEYAKVPARELAWYDELSEISMAAWRVEWSSLADMSSWVKLVWKVEWTWYDSPRRRRVDTPIQSRWFWARSRLEWARCCGAWCPCCWLKLVGKLSMIDW